MTTTIHSVTLIRDDTVVPDAWVAFDGGHVQQIGVEDSWRDVPADSVLDASDIAGPDAILTPGFVDIHGHGGAGHSYDDGPEAIRAARSLHRAHGTTRAVISFVSADPDQLAQRVAMVADLVDTDPDILGSHLEGPFLDPGHRGAHDPSTLLAPNTTIISKLVDAARGTLRQITLAPELPGAAAAIAQFVSAGTAVAVGHTNADYDATRRAFDTGATVLTHAFNAMPGMQHRSPGPVAAALADSRVTIEVIADGIHVHTELVRVLCAAAPHRVALITDAMAAAGSADGNYRLGSLDVEVTDRVARLRDGGSIAGSTLTQDAALRTAVAAGVSITDSVSALTSAPARAVGLAERFGSLAPGRVADAVLLSSDLHVRRVWAAGQVVPEAK